MGESLRNRFEFIHRALGRPWPRRILLLFAFIGAWDTFVAQFLPRETAEKVPNAYSVLAMTSGYLDWWIWLTVGALLIAFICIEFAYRRAELTRAAKPPTVQEIAEAEAGNQHMSLIDAARRAYSESPGSIARNWCENEAQSGSPEEILRHCAFLIIDTFGVPIRGVRPPSDTDELIEWDLSDHSLELENGGLRIGDRYGTGTYTDLMVRRDALPEIIERFQQWGAVVPGKRGE